MEQRKYNEPEYLQDLVSIMALDVAKSGKISKDDIRQILSGCKSLLDKFTLLRLAISLKLDKEKLELIRDSIYLSELSKNSGIHYKFFRNYFSEQKNRRVA